MKFQITFLGSSSLFGRVVASLLRQSPAVARLKLYDEKAVKEVEDVPGSCRLEAHSGMYELSSAMEGSHIVVIGDETAIHCLDTTSNDLTEVASRVINYSFAFASIVPSATLVVAATPLNVMVPLVGRVLKEVGCYDSKKLIGVTSVDTLRANALYSSYLGEERGAILPVVGGASPQTRVPIFSQAKPTVQLPEILASSEELYDRAVAGVICCAGPIQHIRFRAANDISWVLADQRKLIEEIKSFDFYATTPSEMEPSIMERAYATVRLLHSVMAGLDAEPGIAEMALAKTSLIADASYFSLPVDLGPSGIERTFGLPHLSPLEEEMMDVAIVNLNSDMVRAQELFSNFKMCFDFAKSITYKASDLKYTEKQMTSQENQTFKKTSKYQTRTDRGRRRRSSSERQPKQSKPSSINTSQTIPTMHCPAHPIIKIAQLLPSSELITLLNTESSNEMEGGGEDIKHKLHFAGKKYQPSTLTKMEGAPNDQLTQSLDSIDIKDIKSSLGKATNRSQTVPEEVEAKMVKILKNDKVPEHNKTNMVKITKVEEVRKNNEMIFVEDISTDNKQLSKCIIANENLTKDISDEIKIENTKNIEQNNMINVFSSDKEQIEKENGINLQAIEMKEIVRDGISENKKLDLKSFSVVGNKTTQEGKAKNNIKTSNIGQVKQKSPHVSLTKTAASNMSNQDITTTLNATDKQRDSYYFGEWKNKSKTAPILNRARNDFGQGEYITVSPSAQAQHKKKLEATSPKDKGYDRIKMIKFDFTKPKTDQKKKEILTPKKSKSTEITNDKCLTKGFDYTVKDRDAIHNSKVNDKIRMEEKKGTVMKVEKTDGGLKKHIHCSIIENSQGKDKHMLVDQSSGVVDSVTSQGYLANLSSGPVASRPPGHKPAINSVPPDVKIIKDPGVHRPETVVSQPSKSSLATTPVATGVDATADSVIYQQSKVRVAFDKCVDFTNKTVNSNMINDIELSGSDQIKSELSGSDQIKSELYSLKRPSSVSEIKTGSQMKIHPSVDSANKITVTSTLPNQFEVNQITELNHPKEKIIPSINKPILLGNSLNFDKQKEYMKTDHRQRPTSHLFDQKLPVKATKTSKEICVDSTNSVKKPTPRASLQSNGNEDQTTRKTLVGVLCPQGDGHNINKTPQQRCSSGKTSLHTVTVSGFGTHNKSNERPKTSVTDVDLENVLVDKVTVTKLHDFGRSFTMKGLKGRKSGGNPDTTTAMTFSVKTNTDKEKLSKRYTLSKKGDICHMIKDDVNAEIVKAKIFSNQLKSNEVETMMKPEEEIILTNKTAENESKWEAAVSNSLVVNKIETQLKTKNRDIFTTSIFNRISETSPISSAVGERIQHSHHASVSSENIKCTSQSVTQPPTKIKSEGAAKGIDRADEFLQKAKKQIHIAKFLSEKRKCETESRSITNEKMSKVISPIPVGSPKPNIRSMSPPETIVTGTKPLEIPKTLSTIKKKKTLNGNKHQIEHVTEVCSDKFNKSKCETFSANKSFSNPTLLVKLNSSNNTPVQNNAEDYVQKITMEPDEHNIKTKSSSEKCSIESNKLPKESASPDVVVKNIDMQNVNVNDKLVFEEMTNQEAPVVANFQEIKKEETMRQLQQELPKEHIRASDQSNSKSSKQTSTVLEDNAGSPQSTSNKSMLDTEQNLDIKKYKLEHIESKSFLSKGTEQNKTKLSALAGNQPRSQESTNTNALLDHKNKRSNTKSPLFQHNKKTPSPFPPKEKVFTGNSIISNYFSTKREVTLPKEVLTNLGKGSIIAVDDNKVRRTLEKLKESREDKEKLASSVSQSYFAKRPSQTELNKDSKSNEVEETPSGPSENPIRSPFVGKYFSQSVGALEVDPRQRRQRKEIHPSLLHAVKAIKPPKVEPKVTLLQAVTAGSPWANKSTLVASNKKELQRANAKPAANIYKNPFAQGKLKMTSDIYRNYIKSNRNERFVKTVQVEEKKEVDQNQATFSFFRKSLEEKKMNKTLEEVQKTNTANSVSHPLLTPINLKNHTRVVEAMYPGEFKYGDAKSSQLSSMIQSSFATKTQLQKRLQDVYQEEQSDEVSKKGSPLLSRVLRPKFIEVKPCVEMKVVSSKSSKEQTKSNTNKKKSDEVSETNRCVPWSHPNQSQVMANENRRKSVSVLNKMPLGSETMYSVDRHKLKRSKSVSAMMSLGSSNQRLLLSTKEDESKKLKSKMSLLMGSVEPVGAKTQQNKANTRYHAPEFGFFGGQPKTDVDGDSPKKFHLLKANKKELNTIRKEQEEQNKTKGIKMVKYKKRSLSTPSEYHPSFPLSKTKQKTEPKELKHHEKETSTKNTWEKFLDMFQSVISKEKKGWLNNVNDSTVKGETEQMLLSQGPHIKTNTMNLERSLSATTASQLKKQERHYLSPYYKKKWKPPHPRQSLTRREER